MRVKTTPLYPLIGEQKTYIESYRGGRGCFIAGQKIVTDKGNKNIEDIEINDNVKSYNLTTKKIEFKKVYNTFKYQNTKYLKITLKDGTIIKVTENHRFYFNGGWVKVKDIVSLWHERNMESNRVDRR